MPGPAVIPVKELRIHAVQLPHTERKIALWSLDEKMVMVGHEAICMTDPIVSFIDMLEGIEEVLPVLVIFEYQLFFIATRCYMIDCTCIFYSKGSGHGATVAQDKAKCNERDLTLRTLRLFINSISQYEIVQKK
jgi:hypothetical protein